MFVALAIVLGGLPAVAVRPAPARALNNCAADGASLDGEEASFLAIINDYRASNGLSRLSLSDALNRAAAWKATDMGTKNYFGHTDSLGRTPWTLTVDCGYPVAGGENLAAGTYKSTGASAFEMFRNSPTHNDNMLRPDYRQIGIARVFVQGSEYGWYWATEFGTAGEAAVPPAPPPPPPPAAAAPPPPPPPAPPPAPVAQQLQAAPVAPASARPAIAPAPEPAAEPEANAQQVEMPRMPAALVPGLNQLPFTWNAPRMAADVLARPIDSELLAIYSYNSETGEWLRYLPGLPAGLSNLHELQPGQRYWAITSPPLVAPAP